MMNGRHKSLTGSPLEGKQNRMQTHLGYLSHRCSLRSVDLA